MHQFADKFKEAVEKAKLYGHELENDPPVFSSMRRYTCKRCSRAVIGKFTHAYGSATEGPCKKPEETA